MPRPPCAVVMQPLLNGILTWCTVALLVLVCEVMSLSMRAQFLRTVRVLLGRHE